MVQFFDLAIYVMQCLPTFIPTQYPTQKALEVGVRQPTNALVRNHLQNIEWLERNIQGTKAFLFSKLYKTQVSKHEKE